MDSQTRKVAWRFSLAALGLVVGALGVLNAAVDVSGKHAARKKHPHKPALIVLSDDDLPRNGRHYVMVPSTPPPPVVDPRPSSGSSVPPPTAAPNNSAAAAASAVPAANPVPDIPSAFPPAAH